MNPSSSIKVDCIAASACMETGKEIYTLVCEYPRAIHAQLMTHRVFSKNSSSTRAIPIPSAIANIVTVPAKFIWTAKNKGMQGPVITDSDHLAAITEVENKVRQNVIDAVEQLDRLGVHKQNACRYLEPFQNIRIVLTSTEWENWDWLRDDPDAQGEIDELSRAMKAARDGVVPMAISTSEWHLPYVKRERDSSGVLKYYEDTGVHRRYMPLDEAVRVSMSCCAQTSYRKSDTSKEKTERVMENLFNGKKVHASPSEHQANPIGLISDCEPKDWPVGVSHMSRDGELWSGNFKGFIQNRQLIPNHDKALF